MRVVAGYPPNFEEILARFSAACRPSVVFAYGDAVYVPSGGQLSADVAAHERVHLERQAELGPEEWWRRYLDDPDFRLGEELAAYRAQYRCGHLNRAQRRRLLQRIAGDLSGPLYGGLVSRAEAHRLIAADPR